jgi:hypothetical protein
MKSYIELGNRISWQDIELVAKFLSLNNNLDILYDNGTYFIRAIENNNYDIVETLLSYFKKNQLKQYKIGSFEYSSLNQQMYNIIRTAIEDTELSQDMEKLLHPYLNFEDQYQTEDNSGLNNSNSLLKLNELKKSYSMDDIKSLVTNHDTSNSSNDMLHSLGESYHHSDDSI